MQHFHYKGIALVGAGIVCLGAVLAKEAAWGISASTIAVGSIIFLSGLIGSWFND